MTEFIEIDGSMLEGGGQILRLSVSLSAILAVPIRVSNIRARRTKPGLSAQHLTGIKLVTEMCNAKVTGAEMGSMEITFIPSHRIRQGHYVANAHTAGSVSLVLQIALPCAFLADGPVTLDLKGGTNADMAPQIDYFTEIFTKTLTRFGVDVDVQVHRRGYFPKGGGHVTVDVEPVKEFSAVTLLDRGEIQRVYGWTFVAGSLPIKLAYEMAEGFKDTVRPLGDCGVDIRTYKEDRNVAPDNGSGILCAFKTSTGCVVGADGLGRRSMAPRDLGRRVAETLHEARALGACIDNYAQDQVILYMALAEGKSSFRCGALTLHTETAIYIAELITKAKFTTHLAEEENTIECVGIGHQNRHYPDQ